MNARSSIPPPTLDATAIAIKQTLMHITTLDPSEVVPYMVGVLQLAFHLLRDEGRQDDFVRGLLQGAFAELDNPPMMSMKDLRIN